MSVSRLKAYFIVNSSLSGVIRVLIKHRMSTVVDISALRVKIWVRCFENKGPVNINN